MRESVGGPYSPNELQLVQEMLWWDETVADAPNMVAFAIAQVFVSDIAPAVAAVARSTAIKFVSLDRFALRSAPP